MSSAQAIATLHSVLQHVLEQLHDACQQLRQTLEAETDAISHRDLDALTRCGETKKAQLQAVEALDAQRQQTLTQLGWSDSSELNDASLNKLWQTVLTQLQSCQDANEVNGALLRHQQDTVQKTLAIMSGGNGPATLYQADGKASHSANNLPIAKA